MTTRVLVPSGVLGLGFDADALARGIEQAPDIICIDGGSTDSGPYYLGTGTSKYSRATSKGEWRELMRARAAANVPLVIGSCGTCGTDSTVDWMFDITREIACEERMPLRVARLYSSQSNEALVEQFDAGCIRPLDPAPPIDAQRLVECTNIVALAGAEQMAAALQSGADIVLAGRATDTAVISALPLQRGEHAGGAWHGAKIAECGALCSTNPTSGVVMVVFDERGFVVEPMAGDARCTPHSVSAHMLYENANPFRLREPGGELDVSAAHYEALDQRRVRVTGSKWVDVDTYTVKLEGARVAGFQTTLLALLRNQHYVENAALWAHRLHEFLRAEIERRMQLGEDDYSLDIRLIGVDATLGEMEQVRATPVEVGVLIIVTAGAQDTANEIGKLINPWLLHFPLSRNEELPTFAFPYSPVESQRGALYEFCLNHTLSLDDPMRAFRLQMDEIGS